jgi:catechol 2,3-dioxygenase-like lactoylglutathione lyase family enzyme
MSENQVLSPDQLARMNSPIFSIDHVQIPINGDLAEAAAWYQTMFGVGDQLPGPADDIWFAGIPTERGNLMLWKTTDNTSSGMSFRREGTDVPIVMFKTFQLDELHARLIGSGNRIVSYDEPSEGNRVHFRFLKFYDHWGNLLGFIQDPPTVPWYGTR